MTDKGTRKTCAFCEDPNRQISKEHVWPKWLRKHIEHGAGRPIGHARTLHERDTGVFRRDEWTAIPIDWEVEAVCKLCNEGWMVQEIETDVRQVLIPLLERPFSRGGRPSVS